MSFQQTDNELFDVLTKANIIAMIAMRTIVCIKLFWRRSRF